MVGALLLFFFVIGFMSLIAIIEKIIDKVKYKINTPIYHTPVPQYYIVTDRPITNNNEEKDKIKVIEIYSPTNTLKYLCVGEYYYLKARLLETNVEFKSEDIKKYDSIKWKVYIDEQQYLNNLKEGKEALEYNGENIKNKKIKRKLQKLIKNVSKTEILAGKERLNTEINVYSNLLIKQWNELVENTITDYITNIDIKPKSNTKAKKQEVNDLEEYYCERCLKKISYEDYEIYDGMCEECFEEIDLDDKDL